ncbi:MAG: hypothetical protein ACOYD9_02625 [Pyramidobacter sp.]|jgi:hypothetical protein
MLDKQYSRVIRWIHRAQSMSADGKYSDAILDVECARAELDDARQELLLCHHGLEAQRRGGSELRLCLLSALFVLLCTASPLQRDEPLTVASLPAEEPPAVRAAETVAAENVDAERQWGAALRSTTGTAEKLIIEAAAERQALSFCDSGGDNALSLRQKNDFGKKLSEKDVYRLVEVGRRALQHNKRSLAVEFH